MPELPEVEVTRRGIMPSLTGGTVSGVVMRTQRLRYPLPSDLPRLLIGHTLRSIARRGKYLLLDFGTGTLLMHLGMSGSLRLLTSGAAPEKHDHLDLEFGQTLLRLRDPRRFGAVLWLEGDPARHPLISTLGLEPLEDEFTPLWLYTQTRGRNTAIKQALMDSHLVVGIGNIYAAESLFQAGISPLRAANRISRERYRILVPAIRATLETSIAAGGSSVRDYVHSDGGAGCFQLSCAVYDRAGEPCLSCGNPLRSVRQSGRSTFYCAHCQR